MGALFGGVFGIGFIMVFCVYFCGKGAESVASWLGRVVSGDRKAEREFYKEQGANFNTVWFYHNPNWREAKESYDHVKAMDDAALEEERKKQEQYRKEEEQRKDDYMKKLENW